MIEKAVVVGAGVMGHGIAQVLAANNIQTTLIDVNNTVLQKARGIIEQNLHISVSKNKITAFDAEKTLTLINFSFDYDSLSDAQILIEAVTEKIELKKIIFLKADKLLPSDAILATNTSCLSVSKLAEMTSRPESVVGLHFFNPPYIMKLLEIIPGEKTSAATIDKAINFAEQIKKKHILVKDFPGFATSRLGICLGNEAMRMLEEGVASVEDIDTAMMLGYGHPVGPLKLTDMVGLDVRLAISQHLYETLNSEGFKPPRILQQKVLKGELGKKSGHGFYKWT